MVIKDMAIMLQDPGINISSRKSEKLPEIRTAKKNRNPPKAKPSKTHEDNGNESDGNTSEGVKGPGDISPEPKTEQPMDDEKMDMDDDLEDE